MSGRMPPYPDVTAVREGEVLDEAAFIALVQSAAALNATGRAARSSGKRPTGS